LLGQHKASGLSNKLAVIEGIHKFAHMGRHRCCARSQYINNWCLSANFWFGNSWLARAPPFGPLKTPNQNERWWSYEWKKARWCSYFRWCHIALPLYALKVVSLIPCWRWFGYTLTHSSVVSLLSLVTRRWWGVHTNPNSPICLATCC
jgi:hypothetical protein